MSYIAEANIKNAKTGKGILENETTEESKHRKKKIKSDPELAKGIARRIQQLKAVENLEDMYKYKSAYLHPLHGKKEGSFAMAGISVTDKNRFELEPDYGNDPPRKKDGGLDLKKRFKIT